MWKVHKLGGLLVILHWILLTNSFYWLKYTSISWYWCTFLVWKTNQSPSDSVFLHMGWFFHFVVKGFWWFLKKEKNQKLIPFWNLQLLLSLEYHKCFIDVAFHWSLICQTELTIKKSQVLMNTCHIYHSLYSCSQQLGPWEKRCMKSVAQQFMCSCGHSCPRSSLIISLTAHLIAG